MDLAQALALATSIGAVVGVVMRVIPGIQNRLVPLFVLVSTFLADALLVLNRFQDAAGIPHAGLGTGHLLVAGIFGVSIFKYLTGAVLAGAQLILQRAIHEHGWKAVAGKQAAM
jgi:hypothetical protein